MATTYQCKMVVKVNGETHTQFGALYEFMTPAIYEQILFESDFESFGCEIVSSEVIRGDDSQSYVVDPELVEAALKIDRREFAAALN